jgi:oligopeptide/dipeptide ABC transporter ATP-binding protein
VPSLSPLLAVEGLEIAFPAGGAWVPVVRGVSFTVDRGELVGLVGESGSGKSLTALSIPRLVPAPGRIQGGRVLLDGVDLLTLSERQMRAVRGSRVGIVFQEPMTALNPVLSVGFQVAEAVRAHRRLSRAAARTEAVRLLDVVAIPDARRRLGDYPHQLSGGQRQRVMIAMALASSPDLLIADEPTTALDVTIQDQILALLEQLRRDLGLAVLLITHDLAVVAETCDRAVVLYAGEVVEEAVSEELFGAPAHPYTRGLLASLPRLDGVDGSGAVRRGALPAIPGQPPQATELPAGCSFSPRCPERVAACTVCRPELLAVRCGPAGSAPQARHTARCLLLAAKAGEAA